MYPSRFIRASAPHAHSGNWADVASTNWNIVDPSNMGNNHWQTLKDFHLDDMHTTSFYRSLVKANHRVTSNLRKVGKSNPHHAQRRIGNFGEKHQCLPHPPLYSNFVFSFKSELSDQVQSERIELGFWGLLHFKGRNNIGLNMNLVILT